MTFTLDRIGLHQFSYEEFHERYLDGNRPCILQSSYTEDWACRRTWIKDGHLDEEVFVRKYGNAMVPVQDSSVMSDYDLTEYVKISLEDFVNGHLRRSESKMYLKDWHFQRDFPLEEVYEVPEYFSSDWLNTYLDHLGIEDYRFLYLGPAGSWTPLHEDVMQSFSWSANIFGRKRWVLFPPGTEKSFQKEGKLPRDVSAFDLTTVSHLDFIQEPGEIVFVPSRWFHQVWNLEETLSINHNWINGANIGNLWDLLMDRYTKVELEISDCRSSFTEDEWHNHCQLMLKADLGMNFEDFRDMVLVAGKKFLSDSRIQRTEYESFKKLLLKMFDAGNIEMNELKHIEAEIENRRQ